MKRRDVLKGAGVGSAALAMLPLVGTGKALASGERGFRFVATAAGTGAVTGHVLVMNGDGEFDGEDADGGGGFVHFIPGTPPTIVASGEWRAEEVTNFTAFPGIFGGVVQAGVLDLAIELRPLAGGSVPATLRVVCNVPVAGGSTGQAEGISVTAGGNTFNQAAGLTAITPED